MRFKALPGLTCLQCICLLSLFYSSTALSAYRTFLDPRSMAMGGTGVASATKFNASAHNPALIAFNRGSKPDKIHISGSLGTRELYDYDLNEDIRSYQDSDTQQDFLTAVSARDGDAAILSGNKLKAHLERINLSSYRSDETSAFSLLIDTLPVTINFYTRRDIRQIISVRNKDSALIDTVIDVLTNPDSTGRITDVNKLLTSSVDNTYFEIKEFGVTVATTNVYDFNMPISWGYTPKLMEMNGSHISNVINDYQVNAPPNDELSTGLLEWNIDVGFAILLTDDFLEQALGLDGMWLEGEWVFGMSGMNMFPTDFTPYKPARPNPFYVGEKRAVQPLYQIGIAHYREKFMLTADMELSEHEVFDFEGLTRFLSMGGEYYWRDDFHLRAGLRINTSQQNGAAKDKTTLSGGFLYQPHSLSIEAAVMVSDVEIGGTVGFGLTF